MRGDWLRECEAERSAGAGGDGRVKPGHDGLGFGDGVRIGVGAGIGDGLRTRARASVGDGVRIGVGASVGDSMRDEAGGRGSSMCMGAAGAA